MKLVLGLFLLVALTATSQVVAQESASAAPTVETLRAQLVEVQAKESELQARARQLDEDLKPENIERSLAGIGSTHPEELREQRRRELTIQRDGVLAQLKLVTNSRERLESVIRTAEVLAYQQSAAGNATLQNQTALSRSPWVIAALAGAGIALALLVALALLRKTRTT